MFSDQDDYNLTLGSHEYKELKRKADSYDRMIIQYRKHREEISSLKDIITQLKEMLLFGKEE